MTDPSRWRIEAGGLPLRLREVSDELDQLLEWRGVSADTRFAARLVCEEVGRNAFEHGGARFVTLEIDPVANPCLLSFEDDGAPFDSAAWPRSGRPDASDGIGHRGRGLLLVREFSRSIRHRRVDGRNRLDILLVE